MIVRIREELKVRGYLDHKHLERGGGFLIYLLNLSQRESLS